MFSCRIFLKFTLFLAKEVIFLVCFFKQKDESLIISHVSVIVVTEVYLHNFGLLQLLLDSAFGCTHCQAFPTYSFHLQS